MDPRSIMKFEEREHVY